MTGDPATPSPARHEGLSPRARSILREAERSAELHRRERSGRPPRRPSAREDRRSPAAGGPPGRSGQRDGAFSAPPSAFSAPPAPIQPPPDSSSALLGLIDAVMQRAEYARRQLREVTATLDEVAQRVGPPGHTPPPARLESRATPPPARLESRATPPPRPRPTSERRGPGATPASGSRFAQPGPSRPSPTVAPSAAEPSPRPMSASGSPPRPPAASSPPYTPPPPVVPSTPPPSAAPPQAPPADAAPPTDGARLVAIEMAVAGSTRDQVAHRLRHEYGIADPGAILDDVFGRGSGGASRMPWGGT